MKNSDKNVEKLYPELAKEWHPTKNNGLLPSMVSPGSEKKVWWLKKYYDSKTGKTFEFEWEAMISNRVKGRGCPFISGKKVFVGFNDLATTDPQIAREWHPTKNGNITPYMVTRSSNKKYWWLLPYDDLETGKHYEFEWEANINSRCQGRGCPYLSGKAVYVGFNDLGTKYPELAKDWHPTRNGHLMPEMVTSNSEKKVWWLGKCGHEWIASINHRTRGHGCIYCAKSNARVLKGLNDLETIFPEIAKEWHPTKNNNLKPSDILSQSPRKVWWLGKCGHEWIATVHSRTGVIKRGCPVCTKEYKTSFPEQAIFYYLYKEYPDIKNGDRKALGGKELDIYIPSIKTAIEYDGLRWHKDMLDSDIDKANKCNKLGIRLIRIREKGLSVVENCENIIHENNLNDVIKECIYRLGGSQDVNVERDKADILNQYLSVRQRHQWWIERPDLLNEWSYSLNGDLNPYTVYLQEKVWWKCSKCGNSWRTDITHRLKAGNGCPSCGHDRTNVAKYKKVENIDTGEIFESLESAGEKNHISSGNISNCCKGKRARAGGYRWRYIE